MFNFQNEIVRYCKQDVTILRLTCLAFRMRVFRKTFLKKNLIGIVPPRGYRWCDNQSQKAVHWVCWMENCILRRFIEHAGHSREKRLPEGLVVDGYSQPRPEENHRGIVL